jgi:multicomponent Na+:H+ antiporter subunit A
MFAVMWGLSGVMLYLLASLEPSTANTAKKSFIFIGGADAVILLGILTVGLFAGTFNINEIHINLNHAPFVLQIAFVCFCIAALTKAGAMPFHTWIPDFAETMPLSITAFLPASFDKILGIFLLVTITTKLFIMTNIMMYALLTLGSITIIAAVCMAMVQHDMRRLLSYHAVSQVGYMVIGIASGTPLGIIGGVFHMLNNAIYKTMLFLTAGAVEHRTQSTHLDHLGGLAAYMPLTAGVCLVGALSISGIPPFNGFASKWMIYQALITAAMTQPVVNVKTIFFMGAVITAVFGSAFTLASFIKLIHAVFFGQKTREYDPQSVREVGAGMMIPMLTLAVLCILFGIVPGFLPLGKLIGPSLSVIGISIPAIVPFWHNDAALILILIGAIGGLLVFLFSGLTIRRTSVFVGGETLPLDARAPAMDFYQTITDMPLLKKIFKMAKEKYFDIYELSIKGILACGRALSAVQTGSVHTYVLLCILGLVLACAALL